MTFTEKTLNLVNKMHLGVLPPNPKPNIVHTYEQDAQRQVQTCIFQNK